MADPIGHRRWAIAEGYIPGRSTGPEPEMASHDTLCALNASDRDAHLTVTLYFADREPAGPYRLTVPARRTLHARVNELTDPEPVPRDTNYASVVESDVPVGHPVHPARLPPGRQRPAIDRRIRHRRLTATPHPGRPVMAQTAADILIETLTEWGVDTIFSLPGDGTWSWRA